MTRRSRCRLRNQVGFEATNWFRLPSGDDRAHQNGRSSVGGAARCLLLSTRAQKVLGGMGSDTFRSLMLRVPTEITFADDRVLPPYQETSGGADGHQFSPSVADVFNGARLMVN